MPAVALRVPPDAQEQRTYHRIVIDLLGRFMLENRTEYPCRVRDVSPGNVAIITVAKPRIGERTILYLDHLGRIEGTVSRLFQGGFAVVFAVSERKREKLAAQLTWLANRGELNLPEDRRHERVQPRNPFVDVTLADGRKYKVRIIDLSLSGAALQSSVRPAIGSRITIGQMHGRVVRLLEEGFAVEFAVTQTVESLSEL